MASAILDPGIILKLLETQLETVNSSLPVLHLGEADQPQADKWCRAIGLEVLPLARQRGDGEPDLARFTFRVMAVVQRQASSYAIGWAAGVVRAAFRDQTLRDTNNPVEHQVDCTGELITFTLDPDPERALRLAEIAISGQAQRWSGTSITSF